MTDNTHAAYWRSLNIIWGALLVGQLIFFSVILFLRFGAAPAAESTLSVMAAVVALACFFVSFWLNQQRLSQAKKTSNAGQAQISYRSLVIIRSALAEGGNLFVLVTYFLEGYSISLLVFAVGIAYFALRTRPNEVEYRDYFLQ